MKPFAEFTEATCHATPACEPFYQTASALARSDTNSPLAAKLLAYEQVNPFARAAVGHPLQHEREALLRTRIRTFVSFWSNDTVRAHDASAHRAELVEFWCDVAELAVSTACDSFYYAERQLISLKRRRRCGVSGSAEYAAFLHSLLSYAVPDFEGAFWAQWTEGAALKLPSEGAAALKALSGVIAAAEHGDGCSGRLHMADHLQFVA